MVGKGPHSILRPVGLKRPILRPSPLVLCSCEKTPVSRRPSLQRPSDDLTGHSGEGLLAHPT